MNRSIQKWWLSILAGFVLEAAGLGLCQGNPQPNLAANYRLIPYPQKVTLTGGNLKLSATPKIEIEKGAGPQAEIARQQLQQFFAQRRLPTAHGKPTRIVLGVVQSSEPMRRWLTAEEATSLRKLPEQGYLLHIRPNRIVIVGRTGLGTLYGAQTLLQMLEQSVPQLELPLLSIEDYPEVPDRYVAIQLAWYSAVPGQQSFGFGSQLWDEQQWKWFMDWCLRHKINGIDLCMYGRWPFNFPEYPETILANIPVKVYDEKTGQIVTRHMTHPNIEREFLPAVLKYAQARGIRVNAYIGLNSYNGGYIYEHRDSHPFLPEQAKSLGGWGATRTYSYEEMDLSNPAVMKYLRSSLRHIMKMGFDGVAFEMNESMTTVCTKPACVPLFWKGYEHLVTPTSMPNTTPVRVRVRADAWLVSDLYRVITDVRPGAGVGLIYHGLDYRYGWNTETLEALRELRATIPPEVYFTQGPRAPLSGELAGTHLEQWLQIVNRRNYRHGSNLGGPPTVFFNNDPETRGDGGDNDYWLWPLPLAIAQDRAAAKLGLRGSTTYSFGWYAQEIHPLVTAQYAWRSAGPEGVSDKGFLEYGCQSMYGNQLGKKVAKVLALPPPGDPHYQPPPSGDFIQGEAIRLAAEALREYSGAEPEYRRSLQHMHTANVIRAEYYKMRQLQQAAAEASGEQKQALLRQALAQAERVRHLVFTAEPRILYEDLERSLLINYTRIMPENYGKSIIQFPPIQEIRQELGLPPEKEQ